MNQINLRSSNELPAPNWNRTCTIDSQSAQVYGSGLVHLFKLPQIGEYAYNFKLYSNTVLLDSNYNLTYSFIAVPEVQVDSIINYIESVSLCVDSPEKPISYITNIPKNLKMSSSISELNCISGMDLNFLKDSPIITGSLSRSGIYIVVKFKNPPKINYYINYEIGFIDDINIVQQLNQSSVIIPGTTDFNGNLKTFTFKYNMGKLQVI